MLPTLDLVQIITKPVVLPAFLQDWLAFLCQDQGFKVHLLFTENAFAEEGDPSSLADKFPGVKLYRLEKLGAYGAKSQAFVLLADFMDLRYLSKNLHAPVVHSHDTASLLLARLFFPNSVRIHSWWLEDRNAHKLWRLSAERLATIRTWGSIGAEEESEAKLLSQIGGRHLALPSPDSLSGDYQRGPTFETLRELYRTVLRDTDLRVKA